jgi:hypothetical protein
LLTRAGSFIFPNKITGSEVRIKQDKYRRIEDVFMSKINYAVLIVANEKDLMIKDTKFRNTIMPAIKSPDV